MSEGSKARAVWTRNEDAAVTRMRDDEKLPWEFIAQEMKRSVNAVRTRHSELRSGRAHARRLHEEISVNIRVTPEMLADRDARMEASWRRSTTAMFFGDPPPGYSYLDRKQQAEAQRG